MAHEVPELHTLDGFVEALMGNPARGRYFCPPCEALRTMDIEVVATQHRQLAVNLEGCTQEYISAVVPTSRTLVICRECAAAFAALVFNGGNGIEHVLLPSFEAGPVSEHAPSSVNYYLDQAARCESRGANSAAVAMYRATLDMVLFDQGFTKGTLHQKIENAFGGGTAALWATQINKEFLEVIKNLGNGSIHPNDGDIVKQKVLDNALLQNLQLVFKRLLWTIYEEPAQTSADLAQLKSAGDVLNRHPMTRTDDT